MTVENTSTEISYTGNGSVTTFAYNFLVYVEDHLFVFIDGVEQTEGFTISGVGNDSGGNVTFDMPPAIGADVLLQRIVPFTQLIDYQAYGPFDAESNEKGLDLAAMRDLQLERQINSISKNIDDALFRQNGPNDMQQDIDANFYTVKNLRKPVEQNDAVRLADLEAFIPPDERSIKAEEIPPFDGDSFTISRPAEFVIVEIDGRVLPPSYYGFAGGTDLVLLNSPVTVNNKVVARYSVIGGTPTIANEYITPEDFGAVGGLVDDTQAFDQAIAAQRQTGKAILLSKPLYTADINTLPNDILVMFANTNFTTINSINTWNWESLASLNLKNITFNFINTPDGTNGLNILEPSAIEIAGCIFKNAKRTDVVLFDCSNFIISDCRFDDAGREQNVSPGGVNIGCGLILESCKNDGQNPTLIKDCMALRPWQIGFFVYNSDDTTESYGNVIDGCLVFGARDNGIRTQTQGTPFDPFRCRDHVVKGCYVAGSHIDNYRVNGGNNTFVGNISYSATGYGFKSDGGSNNIINNNHDNNSLVAAGLRIGADTINYSISGNTSLNCRGLGGAFYGVVVEDNLNIRGINCSNNAVMSMESTDCSPFAFVVTPNNPNSRFKQLSISNNYSSTSEKQALDIAQADSPFVSCNAFFDNCNTVNAPVITLSDTSNSFGIGNLLQGKLDGTTSFAIEFKNGSNNNKWSSNYMMNFNYDPAFNDFDLNNQINQTFTDFNNSPSLFTVANTSSLGPRLTKNIDVDVIANRATGQESALDVLGIFVAYIADKKDGALGKYTDYENV